MATGLRYNPLEGDHERGHAGKAARGRRLSITALDDEPEGVALPAVVPLHPQPQPQLQQGSLLHQIRTPVRAAAGHSLPVVSPRSGASSAASSRRSSTNAGAGRSPVSFRDSESRGASSSGRSSRRTQRQRTASDDSTPAAAAAMRRAREGSFDDDMEVAALVPRQLLVLSVSSSDADGEAHWKSRWAIVLRGAFRLYRSKRRATAAGNGRSKKPAMWTRLEDISKVFRVTDGITPPGSRRVVKNCLEIHCARFTTFVMAKSSSEAHTLADQLFQLRHLERVHRGGTSKPKQPVHQWIEHRGEHGGAVFFRPTTGECTSAVRDLATGTSGQLHATHVLFEPPPPLDNGAAVAGHSDTCRPGHGGGAHFGDAHACDDSDSTDYDSDGAGGSGGGGGGGSDSVAPHQPVPPSSSSRSGSWRAGQHSPRLKFKPAKAPVGGFSAPRSAADSAHRVLVRQSSQPAAPGLLAELTTPIGDHRGLHVEGCDAHSIVSAQSFRSDARSDHRSDAASVGSVNSQGSLVSGGSGHGTAPARGMLMMQLHSHCNSWAGSRRHLFAPTSPTSQTTTKGRRLSDSTGSSRVSSASVSVATRGSGGDSAGAGGSARSSTWYELWDEASEWPYYVNAATHERRWQWPESPGVRVVHWSEAGPPAPPPPQTPRTAANSRRASAASVATTGQVRVAK